MALPQQPVVTSPDAVARYVDSIDPASSTLNKRFAATDPADVAGVVERARAAQKQWAAQPMRERCALLERLRDCVLDATRRNR